MEKSIDNSLKNIALKGIRNREHLDRYMRSRKLFFFFNLNKSLRACLYYDGNEKERLII